MLNDYHGKAVIITGGVKGIGLATGLAFGRQGAHVYLTHVWDDDHAEPVKAQFEAAGAPEPFIMEADASKDPDTEELLAEVKKDHPEGVEVFVSNVCAVPITTELEALSSRALRRTIDFSVWPLISYLQLIEKTFGRYPRYVIGTSSDGIDHYYKGYDFVAVAKATMEAFGRYLAVELADQGVHVNMVRTRNVLTESALVAHGQDYPDFMRKVAGDKHFMQAEEMADAILAVCSGLLDAMNGQVLTVDRSTAYFDNYMHLYHNRDKLGL